MPSLIFQEQAIIALRRLGYEIVAMEGDFFSLVDSNFPGPILTLDFSLGNIPWGDFREILEYEGVNVSRFLAELESVC